MELCAIAEALNFADMKTQNRANQETQNLASLQMYHGGGEYVTLWDFFNVGVRASAHRKKTGQNQIGASAIISKQQQGKARSQKNKGTP